MCIPETEDYIHKCNFPQFLNEMLLLLFTGESWKFDVHRQMKTIKTRFFAVDYSAEKYLFKNLERAVS